MRLQAPAVQTQPAWQAILGQISDALSRTFNRGQDVRLINGERFSLKSSGGIETFATVDDVGNLLTPFAGAQYVKVSSADPLTIAAPGLYVFTGTTATWTLPAPTKTGWRLRIKNRGSGNLTVTGPSTGQIYTSSAVDTITIAAGASAFLDADGTYWEKL